ncbi:MAG: lipase family alpha/beta hydrolase [bacterium]
MMINVKTRRYLVIYVFSLIGVIGLVSSPVSAKTVVFIHGLLSHSMSWQQSGITTVLQQAPHSWANGGHYIWTPYGIRQTPTTHTIPATVNAYYAVNLPDKSAIIRQSQVLEMYLRAIYAQRQQPLILVAHSAGGLVARYWLVSNQYRRNALPVAGLMTIATPHLGTPLAKYARLGNRLMSPMTPKIMKRYRYLSPILRDVRPEKNNPLLAWLNHQPHPNIAYAAIIRQNQLSAILQSMGQTMDKLIPPYRQDMNHVYALRGQAVSLRRNRGHGLTKADGWDILHWLRQFK